MRRFFLLLCLASSCLHAAAPEPLSSSETSSLLDRIASSRQGAAFQSDFREEKHLALMNKPVVESGTVAFLPPDMFRRDVPGKSLTLCDGSTLWMYYPGFKEAEKYSLAANRTLRESLTAMTAGLALQDISRNYSVKAWRTAQGFRLQLVPLSGALRKSVASITLDLNSRLSADRMEITGPRDESTVTTFSNERRVSLSPADFTFRPPAGVSVSEPLGK